MNNLVEQVTRTAAKVVEMSNTRDGQSLDYSEASVSVIEDMIKEASAFVGEMTPEQRDILVQDFGCYILEVARREFGGRYQ
jgi:hypothetical protein